MENEPGSQGLFLLHVNSLIPWHKISVFEKIYDVINKAYTYKFENLTIFIAFPLPSMETGTKFHVFNLIWPLNEPGDLSFLLHSSM